MARGALGRSLDKPDPSVRFYLFYGPDESQSRGHADRLLTGLQAEKFVIAPGAAKSDPALLADEAGAIGLFGGKRAIWIEPAGEDIVPAVEALLEAPGAESPVIAISGALRKTSALVKLAESDAAALAHISYDLSERDSEQLVEELARSEGLRLAPGVAARVAAAAAGHRGIIAQEIAKIALYVGASPEGSVTVDRDVLEEIGAGSEGDWLRLGDLALAGDLDELAHQLELSSADAEPIVVIRALQRRLLMLGPIRARVDRGESPRDAMASAGKALFWKDKDLVAKLIATWDSNALGRILERSGELERALMRGDSPPPSAALEEELVAIARAGRRR
ncbi:MAG TPA: DNA polymerase III subunit delta [Sphingomicrobium sp.]|nr:DNA polymerase III subunit delta [Sphingomicrobium sp.]